MSFKFSSSLEFCPWWSVHSCAWNCREVSKQRLEVKIEGVDLEVGPFCIPFKITAAGYTDLLSVAHLSLYFSLFSFTCCITHAPLEMDHVWSRLLWFPMYTLVDVGAGISMRRSESLRATEGACLCIAVNKILISQQVSFVEVWSMYAWDCTIWFCQVELYKLLNCLHIIEQLLVLRRSQDPRS